MRPNLAGRYVLSMPWIEPQPVTVTNHGNTFIVQMRDRFDRYRIYESRYIGYEVTEFRTRTPSSLARLVVYGQWEKAFFIDDSGRYYNVNITG